MTRLFVAAAALICLFASGVAESAVGFDPFSAATIESPPDARISLDATFQDETGKRVTLRDLGQGKPILLAPVLYKCPNICGVTLGALSDAVASQTLQPGRDFAVIALGIDPHETPDDARGALAALGARDADGVTAKAFHAVTGGQQDVAAVTDALGYRYAYDADIRQYAHVAAVALLTADGRLARWLPGIATDPADLRLALFEAGEGRIGNLADRLLLLCYHYDPKTGRYSLVVTRMLQVGGVLTAISLASFIVFAMVRERRNAGPAS